MSHWILIGPLVGVLLIAAGLILGIVIFPPLVEERITEVKIDTALDRNREAVKSSQEKKSSSHEEKSFNFLFICDYIISRNFFCAKRGQTGISATQMTLSAAAA